MKKAKTPLVPTAKVANSNPLRIRRRSVANLTENQMGDAAGGHPHHTCEPTCPATCCPTARTHARATARWWSPRAPVTPAAAAPATPATPASAATTPASSYPVASPAPRVAGEGAGWLCPRDSSFGRSTPRELVSVDAPGIRTPRRVIWLSQGSEPVRAPHPFPPPCVLECSGCHGSLSAGSGVGAGTQPVEPQSISLCCGSRATQRRSFILLSGILR